ncbi:MAG: hypothetical protein EOO28_27655 [Comamonadaceae bacterium]|nr:MAG: hypothetical protein EOO28_27655 [Comamonadaceae bacterium]
MTSCYRSSDALKTRTVGETILCGTVEIPAPPTRLVADWERDIAQQLQLEPGDVEALPLARARMRWPDYRPCVDAASGWLQANGIPGLPGDAEVALMACRGARYHHDGAQYSGAAFCNLFLGDDVGLDLHFPHAGLRIPLVRGTVVVFDTCQPHAVIDRQGEGFHVADFPADRDCSLVFLTWELPVEHTGLACALGITFDVGASTVAPGDEGQLRLDGAPADLCAESGRWTRTA